MVDFRLLAHKQTHTHAYNPESNKNISKKISNWFVWIVNNSRGWKSVENLVKSETNVTNIVIFCTIQRKKKKVVKKNRFGISLKFKFSHSSHDKYSLWTHIAAAAFQIERNLTTKYMYINVWCEHWLQAKNRYRVIRLLLR